LCVALSSSRSCDAAAIHEITVLNTCATFVLACNLSPRKAAGMHKIIFFMPFLADLFADRRNVPQEKQKKGTMDFRDILNLYLAIFSECS